MTSAQAGPPAGVCPRQPANNALLADLFATHTDVSSHSPGTPPRYGGAGREKRDRARVCPSSTHPFTEERPTNISTARGGRSSPVNAAQVASPSTMLPRGAVPPRAPPEPLRQRPSRSRLTADGSNAPCRLFRDAPRSSPGFRQFAAPPAPVRRADDEAIDPLRSSAAARTCSPCLQRSSSSRRAAGQVPLLHAASL